MIIEIIILKIITAMGKNDLKNKEEAKMVAYKLCNVTRFNNGTILAVMEDSKKFNIKMFWSGLLKTWYKKYIESIEKKFAGCLVFNDTDW